MSYDPDFEVNVEDLSDADLVRFAADCMRPTPAEHSTVSARLYNIATKVGISDTARRREHLRAKFTILQGGKDVS